MKKLTLILIAFITMGCVNSKSVGLTSIGNMLDTYGWGANIPTEINILGDTTTTKHFRIQDGGQVSLGYYPCPTEKLHIEKSTVEIVDPTGSLTSFIPVYIGGNVSVPGWENKPEIAKPEWLQQLIEYEKECYNDSTLIDVYVDPNIRTEISPGIYSTTSMLGYYKKEWQHKEPTLPGFSKWASKKYEK